MKQIIDGNHVKRGTEAHTVTLHAPFTMFQEAFFEKHPHLFIHLQKVAKEVEKACAYGGTEKIKETYNNVIPFSLGRVWRDE